MEAEQILKHHDLKNTGCRKCIINALLTENAALSEHEIKQTLPDLFDRVTFYRSLKTLEEKRVIHRIILHDSTIKYALNKDVLLSQDHAHFHCVKCDNVMCLEKMEKTAPTLPKGFSVNTVEILYEGTCPHCIEK